MKSIASVLCFLGIISCNPPADTPAPTPGPSPSHSPSPSPSVSPHPGPSPTRPFSFGSFFDLGYRKVVNIDSTSPQAPTELKQAIENLTTDTDIVLHGAGKIILTTSIVAKKEFSARIRAADPKAKPTIVGTKVTQRGCLQFTAGVWVLEHFVVTGCNHAKAGNSSGAIWVNGAVGVKLRGMEITGNTQGVFGHATHEIQIQDSHIHKNTLGPNPGHKNGHGVYIYGGPLFVAVGNRIESNAGQGLHIRAMQTVLSTNVISGNHYQFDIMNCLWGTACGSVQTLEATANTFEARPAGERNSSQMAVFTKDTPIMPETGKPSPLTMFEATFIGNTFRGHGTTSAIKFIGDEVMGRLILRNNVYEGVARQWEGKATVTGPS